MNNNGVGLLFLVGFVLAIFVMGFWSGLTIWKMDTFDCVVACNSTHSVYNIQTNTCYCEVTK